MMTGLLKKLSCAVTSEQIQLKFFSMFSIDVFLSFCCGQDEVSENSIGSVSKSEEEGGGKSSKVVFICSGQPGLSVLELKT